MCQGIFRTMTCRHESANFDFLTLFLECIIFLLLFPRYSHLSSCMWLNLEMGFVPGFIAMYATLASRDVDCCLIPESPFYLEGAGGLFEYIDKRLKENGHMVLVVAEGTGQELMSKSIESLDNSKDASGNKLLQDVGLWISQRIKVDIVFKIAFWLLSSAISRIQNRFAEHVSWFFFLQDHFSQQGKMAINLKYIGRYFVVCCCNSMLMSESGRRI